MLLTLSLVGYPAIAPISILAHVPSYFVSVPFRAVVLGLALAIIARTIVSQVRFRMTPFGIVFSVFWILYVARMLADHILAPAALRLPLSEYLLFALGTCLLPAVAVCIRISPRVLNQAFHCTLLLGALAIVVNVAVIATQLSAQSLAAFFTGRLASKTLDPISLAHLGVTVFILSAWGLIRRDVRGSIPVLVLLTTSLTGFAAAVMAASRGPLITLVVVGPLLLWEGFRADRRAVARIAAGMTLPALMIIWVLRNIDNVFAFTRLRGLASDEVRRGLWQAGWDLFLAKPVLGGGTEPLGMYPHNTVLESFILFGVFSGIMYLAMVIIAARAAMLILNARSTAGWTSLVFLQVTIGMMVSGALYGPPSQWVLMLVVVSLWFAISRRSESVLSGDAAGWTPQYIT